MSATLSESGPHLQVPHDLDAEQGLLGYLLFQNELLDKLDEFSAADFAEPLHQRIFTAITAIVAAGQLADAVTVKARMADDAGLRAIGTSYLMQLMERGAVISSQALAYADVVRDLAQRRAVIRAAQDAMSLALHPPSDVSAADITIRAQRGFDQIARGGGKLRRLGEAAHSFIANLDRPQGRAIPTGYEKLDKRLGGGLFRGDLIVLSGRPSMGKTALANNIARNAAKADFKVGMVSAEMHAEALAMRALAAQQYGDTEYGYERFAYAHLRNGAPHINRAHLRRAAAALAKLPLLIDDRAGLTVEQIEWSARAMRRELGGLDLLVVDYLQILGRPYRPGANDAAIIGMMTQALKTLARSLNVALVLLSQLSRAVEQREDKRPQLADLRESGAIEQDADVVMGVFREAYYLERREPRVEDGNDKLIEWTDRMALVRDTIETIILKQRNGPIGTDVLKALVAHDLILNT